MNKTKIEWCDYTWNPVRGCLHDCPYCYGKRVDGRFGDGSFAPTFHPERLQQPLRAKKTSRIFVGSMADLFGEWDWKTGNNTLPRHSVVGEILDIVDQCPQHTFIFLTKNPRGMQGFDFPANCWCGTSVENQEKADARIPELLRVKCKTKFISLEPILGAVDFDFVAGPGDPDWLIIGAQTGPGAVKPNADWIDNAISQCMEANVPVFVKDNVGYPEQIQMFPGVSE